MDIICLNTRKSLTADLEVVNAVTQEHLSSCAGCSDYYASMKAFYGNVTTALKIDVPVNLQADIMSNIRLEEKLSTAMQIDVPEGLASRILMAQRMSEADTSNVHVLKPRANSQSATSTTNNNFKWMSIAAGVVLAVGLSIGTYKLGESHGFEQQVFAHVNEDAFAVDRNDNIQLAAFNEKFRAQGIQANESIGTIRYAGNCPVDGKLVPHFVLDFNGNSLTVAYIPDETINKRRMANERFEGLVFGAGFMILAEEKDNSSLKDMQKHVMNSIELVDI